MPFAVCPACEAVFIVGSPGRSGRYGQCPYCRVDLELVPQGGQRRTEPDLDPQGLPRTDEPDPGSSAAELRQRGPTQALAV